MPAEERLIIKPLAKPLKETPSELMRWFCKALDLEDKVEPEILKNIVSRSISGEGITSKELCDWLEIPRTTVIYHLNRFISSGLIIRKGRKYFLRSMSMEDTIADIQADMLREFGRLLEFAEKFDELVTREFYGRAAKREKKGRE
ncbi:MAG: hypothetical protein ACP5RT_02185 [Candidatus Micrarchaeia archaeon]